MTKKRNEIDEYIYSLIDENTDLQPGYLIEQAQFKFNTELNYNSYRQKIYRYKKANNIKTEREKIINNVREQAKRDVETIKGRMKKEESNNRDKEHVTELTINENGTHDSKMLLVMTEEQSKDPNYILKAHGYDPSSWTLKKSASKAWNVYSKVDGHKVSYSSSIVAEPINSVTNFDKLLEKISNIKPYSVSKETNQTRKSNMLEIPLFDMHFGISDFKHYKPHLNKLLSMLNDNKYDEVNIIVGQDLFHNDDFRGRTSSGREIEKVDMEKAWEDATNFFSSLIHGAYSNANKVHIVYSKGNHDESHSWAFAKALENLFSETDITFDNKYLERKIITYGNNIIGLTHGEKANFKNLDRVFTESFPEVWNPTRNREIHTGHLHTEMTSDIFGCVVRRLPTSNKTDTWHEENGYVGSKRRFQVFEWTKQGLSGIYYID